MGPALSRIKRAIRAGIAICGGVDGASATASRSRSVAGAWNNLNDHAFPPLDAVLALDEIAVSQGRVPPIVAALAAELGGVFVPGIDVGAEEGTPAHMAMQLAQTLGMVAGEIAGSLADDGRIDRREAEKVIARMDEHNRTAQRLLQQLQRIASGDDA